MAPRRPGPRRRGGRAPCFRRAFTLASAVRGGRYTTAASAMPPAPSTARWWKTPYSPRNIPSTTEACILMPSTSPVWAARRRKPSAVELGRGYYASGRTGSGGSAGARRAEAPVAFEDMACRRARRLRREQRRALCPRRDVGRQRMVRRKVRRAPGGGWLGHARFDDARWSRAMAAPAPGGALRARVTPPCA